jgi:hypothetical protein
MPGPIHFTQLTYPPSVRELSHSLTAQYVTMNWDGTPSDREWRLKLALEDGTRVSMDEVAREAIALWQGFFADHNLYS